jgi:hypothetical protein
MTALNSLPMGIRRIEISHPNRSLIPESAQLRLYVDSRPLLLFLIIEDEEILSLEVQRSTVDFLFATSQTPRKDRTAMNR